MVESSRASHADDRAIRNFHQTICIDDPSVCQHHGRARSHPKFGSHHLHHGPVINGSMTVISVLFGIFMDLLELLVAFIQAYVFTMLSAVFIGLSRIKEEN
jgi:hypothetical protein